MSGQYFMPPSDPDTIIIGKNNFGFKISDFHEKDAQGLITKEEMVEVIQGIHNSVDNFNNLKWLTCKYFSICIFILIIFLLSIYGFASEESVKGHSWMQKPENSQ